MKNKFGLTLALATLLAAAGSTAAFAEAAGFGAQGAKGRGDLPLEQMLTCAIQDEYLARAEYELIMREFGRQRPFSNIAQAEERHIEWLQPLFRSRGLAVPKDDAAGHVKLPVSWKAAVEAGVQAELENIGMYESFLAAELPPEVRDVFQRLKNASENHLQAFRRQLERFQ